MFHHRRNPHASLQAWFSSQGSIWMQIKSWSHLDFSLQFFLSSGSPIKPPHRSPLKRSMVPGSFYGKRTEVYLTPLERKAIKESVPFLPPPLSPPAASPPAQKMTGKKKIKGSKKPGNVATQSKKTDKKLAALPFSTVAKTIKLSKTNNRFVFLSSQCQLFCNQWLFGIGTSFARHAWH